VLLDCGTEWCLVVKLWYRDRPKFGFGFGTETSDVVSFGYGRNREARFRPTFGYGRNYAWREPKLPLLAIR